MTKRKQGFAVMDQMRVKELASKGGKAVHAAGTRYKWTRETASAAGRKGGRARAMQLIAARAADEADVT